MEKERELVPKVLGDAAMEKTERFLDRLARELPETITPENIEQLDIYLKQLSALRAAWKELTGWLADHNLADTDKAMRELTQQARRNRGRTKLDSDRLKLAHMEF